MRYPVNEFKTKWYDAQGFGVKTSYGYHEGSDLNLKTGGDTDLGQTLYAIADGTVTSVHNHTTANTFGNHVHIEHNGPWGKVYSHYAHCQSIAVKIGQFVKEGDVVGKLGKSGTSFAHLHFCIKKEPTGIDGIAKTTADLAKWTAPIPFIEKYMVTNSPPSDMDNLPLELQRFSLKWRDLALKYGLDVNSPQFTNYRDLDSQIAVLVSNASGNNQELIKLKAEFDAYKKRISETRDKITGLVNSL